MPTFLSQPTYQGENLLAAGDAITSPSMEQLLKAMILRLDLLLANIDSHYTPQPISEEES